jgi:hypothetical protein
MEPEEQLGTPLLSFTIDNWIAGIPGLFGYGGLVR